MMDESYDKSGKNDPPAYADTGADYSSPATHTSTTTTTETARLQCNKGYVTSIPGILKLVQAVCSLVCLICASIYPGASPGWCGFVAGWVFFFALVWFFLYLFNLVAKIHPVRVLVEWVYYLVMSILFLVSAILAAVFVTTHAAPAMGAYAFFGFICTAALIVDVVLQFKVWRTEGHTVTTHTTTTQQGTHTTHEVRY